MRLPLLIVVTAVLASAHRAPGSSIEPALVDGFEVGTLPWTATKSDGQATIHRLSLEKTAARRGNAGVFVDTTTSDSGCVQLEYNVGRAPIIRELSTGIWVRGKRPGIQLTARVVLPRSINPKNGLPVEFWEYGTSYEDIGRWQQLIIDDLVQKTTRRARKLRLQFGPTLDERGAYVDRVILRIRPGRGRTTFAIDDLSLAGHLKVRPPQISSPTNGPTGAGTRAIASANASRSPPHRDLNVVPSEYATPANNAARSVQLRPRVVLQGSTLLVDGRPFFPRIIEHKGELFAKLRKLGFNAVALPLPATPEQLAAAREAGLWVVCPPPPIDQMERGELADGWNVVLAWNLGSSLTLRDLPLLERQSAALHRNDPWRRRPIVGQVSEDKRALSRVLDVILIDSSNRPHQPAAAQLRSLISRHHEATPGTPCWIIVPTDPPRPVIEQARLLAERSGAPHRPFGLDDGTIERLALLGVAAGGRGLLFTSTGGAHSVAQSQAELELINQTLAPLDPLIAESQIVPGATRFRAGGADSLLRSRDQMLLRFSDIRPATGERRPGHSGQPMVRSIVIPGVPETSNVFRWTPAGMEPLPHRRVAGGIRVDLGESRKNDLLLLMRDRKVISALAQQANASSRRALQLAGVLATQQLARVRQAHGPLVPVATGERASRTAVTAQRQIASAANMARQGDLVRAFGATMAVREQLGSTTQTDHHDDIGRPTSTAPWAGYRVASQLDSMLQHLIGSVSDAKTLVHGQFDELARSRGAGWRHVQSRTAGARAHVEITRSGARQGAGCLHLSFRSPGAKPPSKLSARGDSPIQPSPLWITSPAVPVASGDLIRIRGWVRVETTDAGGQLDVVDSMGGNSLAVRIGATGGWQPFELYRIAPRSEMTHVAFAVRGLADVWLDDVRIEHLILSPKAGAKAGRTDLFAAPTSTR